jgi:hypothetical protein
MVVISVVLNSQIGHLYFCAWSCYVKGNERADRLAGEASVQDGAVMDRSDILIALREIGRSSDSVQ